MREVASKENGMHATPSEGLTKPGPMAAFKKWKLSSKKGRTPNLDSNGKLKSLSQSTRRIEPLFSYPTKLSMESRN